ncbi:MAG: hypothetical protein V1646_02715 [bacterium]
MASKIQGIFGALFVGLIFQSDVQFMNSGYSYVQHVIDTKQNVKSSDAESTAIFPKFPSSLNILGDEFIYIDQYRTAFRDDYEAVIVEARHGLYELKVAANTFIRVLISIKLGFYVRSAYYTLNIDKLRDGKILNAVLVLPKELYMDESFAMFVLPVEEIIEQLVEIVAGFKRNS